VLELVHVFLIRALRREFRFTLAVLVTGLLTPTRRDLERIPRYAFDYGNGGWENRLRHCV
jgi:hypothetical protein